MLGNSAVAYRAVVADNARRRSAFGSAPAHRARLRSTVTVGVTAADTYGVNRVELLVNGAVVGRDTHGPVRHRAEPGRPAVDA